MTGYRLNLALCFALFFAGDAAGQTPGRSSPPPEATAAPGAAVQPLESARGAGTGPDGKNNPVVRGRLELLTPAEGMDLTEYLKKILESVRRDCYSMFVQSVSTAETGKVVIRFQVMRDGSVSATDLTLESASSVEELNHDAMVAILSSAPFQGLPGKFKGASLKLRLTLMYNLPLDPSPAAGVAQGPQELPSQAPTEPGTAPKSDSITEGVVEAPQPKKLERIMVAGNAQRAKMLRSVPPKYPQAARYAHIQGKVVLRAIISKEGSVIELQFVSGPRELMKSAADAVWQWIYQPTLVDGKPVEVETTISVTFTLGG